MVFQPRIFLQQQQFPGNLLKVTRSKLAQLPILLITSGKILQPVIVRDWKVDALEGLSGEAEEARTALMKHIARVGKVGARIASRRQEKAAQLEPANA